MPVVPFLAEVTPVLPPNPLPEEVRQGTPSPGRLMLDAGRFFRRDLAQRQAARIAGLGARVEQRGSGRSAEYQVLAGPFRGAAEAEAAFGSALGAGLPEARLVVD